MGLEHRANGSTPASASWSKAGRRVLLGCRDGTRPASTIKATGGKVILQDSWGSGLIAGSYWHCSEVKEGSSREPCPRGTIKRQNTLEFLEDICPEQPEGAQLDMNRSQGEKARASFGLSVKVNNEHDKYKV